MSSIKSSPTWTFEDCWFYSTIKVIICNQFPKNVNGVKDCTVSSWGLSRQRLMVLGNHSAQGAIGHALFIYFS